jgi:hypothetical protein
MKKTISLYFAVQRPNNKRRTWIKTFPNNGYILSPGSQNKSQLTSGKTKYVPLALTKDGPKFAL